MSTVERTWGEWFRWHLDPVPFQLAHMRELAESTIAAQDTSAVVVSGSSEKARLPYRVDPADDADLLYATLIIFGREIAEKVGGASPRALRERMWTGRDEPQGLPLGTPSDAFTLASEIILWLRSISREIEHRTAAGELGDSPTDLVRVIREMRGRYPRAEAKFKAYRPRPCPATGCGEYTLYPIWGPDGLHAIRCDTCGARWDTEHR
ncbi:hypothetical protein MUN78_04495 [Leucobacter allii]|uniref:Uncharacterized protein n=1 Tax=Leucobacter allii TaxID=2932247 RepID=A0ABY4FPA5_9MICO|nr:hypothetical protein [Leucobacter allii]UOQ58111.1 hypothetical protein MUN78_04495 [Leucobacter allii]